MSYPRIFIYLSLRSGERLLLKSKIREFGALHRVFEEMRELVVSDPIARELAVDPGALKDLTFDYVDANTDIPLVSMRSVDDGLVVSGCIPRAYQARMLSEEAEISVAQSVAGAAPSFSVLGMIRRHIGAGERFEFRIAGSEGA